MLNHTIIYSLLFFPVLSRGVSSFTINEGKFDGKDRETERLYNQRGYELDGKDRETEEELLPFFPSGSLTQTLFHKLSQDSLLSVKKKKLQNIHILFTHIAAMCAYPVQPVAHPSHPSCLY